MTFVVLGSDCIHRRHFNIATQCAVVNENNEQANRDRGYNTALYPNVMKEDADKEPYVWNGKV